MVQEMNGVCAVVKEVEVPVEKIVYKDRIVEKIVEKPVDKIGA
jgi:hypothetical protein